MSLLQKIRVLIYLKIYENLYNRTGKKKYKDKVEHYYNKYRALSAVSYKKFRNYIKDRENLPLSEYEKIAAPLPYDVKSDEIWAWNDYYGTAEIYKKYAGFPQDYKLKFIIDHAIYYYNNYFNPEEYEVKLPAHICTSQYAKNNIEKNINTKLFPTGLHIFYADDYYSEEQFLTVKKKLGKNLLVFPCHSSDCLLVDWKPDKLIDEILRVQKEHNFDSVTICFYFCEIQRGFHKNFEGHGFNFVTAGHIMDPKFLSRLKTIINLSDVTMSNAIGSHVFYSIGLNKPHYLIQEEELEYHNTLAPDSEAEEFQIKDQLYAKEDAKSYYDIFAVYTEELTPEQKEIRDKISGYESKRTPEEIREFFKETEDLYKNGDYLKYQKYIHTFSMMSYIKKNRKD